MKTGFRIKTVTVTAGPFTYKTHRLTGWLNGQRIRRQFEDRAEAEGEKARLEVEAANLDGNVRARPTRLSVEQLAEAESAFQRLSGKSLSLAVEFFLKNYRPPVTPKPLPDATAAFLAARKPHVSASAFNDYSHTLRDLVAAFPGRAVHEVSTAELQAFLAARNVGKKRFNNLRGDLHAFFAFGVTAPQKWAEANPVTPIPKFKIARGIPSIISAATAADLMAFVETYAGGARSKLEPGCLAPYFALCLFGGLRPSVPHGEVYEIGQLKDPSRIIDLPLGVIRVTPEISKTNELRSVTIRPNLAAWLMRYPMKRFPIIPKNAQAMITEVRKKFGLGDDVLRHTFISAHVAKYRSLGGAALEAGNSERMIKRHYLNMISEADADTFWGIMPGSRTVAEVVALAAG